MRGIFDDTYTDEELDRFYRIVTLGLLLWIIAETVGMFAC